MTVTLDHMIVAARDKSEAATFLADVLGLPAPTPMGPFLAVSVGEGLTLDFADAGNGNEVRPLHLAFAVSEAEFDAIFGRIEQRALPFWADPHCSRPGEIGQRGRGRGFYFQDPNNHFLEVLTRGDPESTPQ
jgi:extradiol dioxygenase family protein